MSANRTIKNFREAPEYQGLREYFALEAVVDYLGDCDSISSFVQQLEDDEYDEVTVGAGNPSGIIFSEFLDKLITLNEEYIKEIAPQLEPHQVVYNRDVMHAVILTGGRVLLGADISDLVPTT